MNSKSSDAMLKNVKMRQTDKLQQTRDFLTELGRLMPEGQRLILGFAENANIARNKANNDGDGVKNNTWWPEPLKDNTYFYSTRNCYVAIASAIKTPNPKTGKMRYWRGTASFGAALAFYVDDIGNGAGSKGKLSLDELSDILPPTVVIETSPNNYQAWYFFSEAVLDANRFKAFLDCFTVNVLKGRGGDVTINDIMRVGRLPYGVNNKVDDDGMLRYPVVIESNVVGHLRDSCGRISSPNVRVEPFQPRIVSSDYSIRYTIEHIAEKFKFSIYVPAPRVMKFDADELKFDAWCYAIAKRVLAVMKMGEGTDGNVVENQSKRCRIKCIWGHHHTNGDSRGAYFRGPVDGEDAPFVYGCSHHSCKGKGATRGWSEFTETVVMPQVYKGIKRANSDENVRLFEQHMASI